MKYIRLFKGGGNDTVESIPDWARPYIENVAQEAERVYQSGALSSTAGINKNLANAFGAGRDLDQMTQRSMADNQDQQTRLAGLAETGGVDQGLLDAYKLRGAMETAQIGRQYGAQGTLGSARQHVQQGASDAALQAALAKEAFGNRMTAEQGLSSSQAHGQGLATTSMTALGQAGQAQRGIEQEYIDTPWKGAERLASTIYGNPARQSASAGGGK